MLALLLHIIDQVSLVVTYWHAAQTCSWTPLIVIPSRYLHTVLDGTRGLREEPYKGP
jgi:hypothetical protein